VTGGTGHGDLPAFPARERDENPPGPASGHDRKLPEVIEFIIDLISSWP
jgi:hypothetical protein